MIQAAGLLIVCRRLGRPDTALFVRRSADSDAPGCWCIPGGKVEAGEAPEDAAEREALEEIGPNPHGMPIPWTHEIGPEIAFTTFLAHVPAEFVATLNDEHTAWCWAPPSDPPQPLHPGCLGALAKLTGIGPAASHAWVWNDEHKAKLDAAVAAVGGLADKWMRQLAI